MSVMSNIQSEYQTNILAPQMGVQPKKVVVISSKVSSNKPIKCNKKAPRSTSWSKDLYKAGVLTQASKNISITKPITTSH